MSSKFTLLMHFACYTAYVFLSTLQTSQDISQYKIIESSTEIVESSAWETFYDGEPEELRAAKSYWFPLQTVDQFAENTVTENIHGCMRITEKPCTISDITIAHGTLTGIFITQLSITRNTHALQHLLAYAIRIAQRANVPVFIRHRADDPLREYLRGTYELQEYSKRVIQLQDGWVSLAPITRITSTHVLNIVPPAARTKPTHARRKTYFIYGIMGIVCMSYRIWKYTSLHNTMCSHENKESMV